MRVHVKIRKIKRCMDCPELWHPRCNPGMSVPFFYCMALPVMEELSLELVRNDVAIKCPLKDIGAICTHCGLDCNEALLDFDKDDEEVEKTFFDLLQEKLAEEE